MILYVYEKLFIIIKRNEAQIIEVTHISVCKHVINAIQLVFCIINE